MGNVVFEIFKSYFLFLNLFAKTVCAPVLNFNCEEKSALHCRGRRKSNIPGRVVQKADIYAIFLARSVPPPTPSYPSRRRVKFGSIGARVWSENPIPFLPPRFLLLAGGDQPMRTYGEGRILLFRQFDFSPKIPIHSFPISILQQHQREVWDPSLR